MRVATAFFCKENCSLFGGFEARKELERKAYLIAGGGYIAPAQYYGDFVGARATSGGITSSYLPGVSGANLNELLPAYVTDSIKEGMEAFGRQIKGFNQDKALFIAPETHSSCPIRMERNDKGHTGICIAGRDVQQTGCAGPDGSLGKPGSDLQRGDIPRKGRGSGPEPLG